MKRCIAILTLVTAMSAGEAFAQIEPARDGYDVLVWTLSDCDFNDVVLSADSLPHYPAEFEFGTLSLGGQEGSEVSVSDDATLGIIAAIAIPNLLEAVIDVVDTEGPEAAYQMLRDIGFGSVAADEMLVMLQQAGVSVLGQANSLAQGALR